MKSAHWRILVPASALIALAAAPALAQRPLSPEERVLLLEQQLSASRAAAMQLEQRLAAIERQLQQLLNQSEVTANRLATLEREIGEVRRTTTDRLKRLESRPAVVKSEPEQADPPLAKPKTEVASASPELPARPRSEETAEADPGEEAYSVGFRLWRDGKYDQAITSLRAFLSGFPDHRRASFARNLIGRALLDKGQPRPAAEALLANYRTDPKGERAPDSLYYLGQALMKLDQPGQACKAYAELEEVYGSAIRADLRSLLSEGKSEARCS